MNVRKILLLLSLFYSVSASADFSDKISVYLNGRLVATIMEGHQEDIRIDFHAGDTLTLDCVTDWGGLERATLDILSKQDSVVKKLPPWPYRRFNDPHSAHFILPLPNTASESALTLTLNYHHDENIKPWFFATITLHKMD